MKRRVIYDNVYLKEIHDNLDSLWFHGNLNLFTSEYGSYLININPNAIEGFLYLPFITKRDKIPVMLIKWQGIE